MTLETILASYPEPRRDYLIPLLQDVQRVEGFISEEAVVRIGRHLQLSTAKIYGVATFYNQFRFQPQGKCHIQVCRGTACHVRGSASVLDSMCKLLKVVPGQTTRDGLFSLEVVACIGACGLAPVISMNGEFHAAATAQKLPGILNTYKKRLETEAKAVRPAAASEVEK